MGAGDDISYTITSELNKKKVGDKAVQATDLTGYAVFDDALQAAYKTPGVDSVSSVKIGTTVLQKTTDYTVSTENKADGRLRIKVSFTNDGLGKIAAAVNTAPEAKVVVAMKFKVADQPPAEVENKFGFVPGHGANEPSSPEVVPPESANPKTKFADFQIKKVKATDTANGVLKDAKFKVFALKAAAAKCAADPSEANCQEASSFGERSTQASGLTAVYKAKVGTEFYIVETEAPSGFVRSGEVTSYTVTDTNHVAVIENVAKADSGFWFTLPKTGAAGIIIFALAGVALVGTGSVMLSRKKVA